MQKRHLIAGLLLAATLPAVAESAELRAGLAEINEPFPARILILRNETNSVAIVASDLSRFQSQRLAEEARRTLRLDMVLFAASGSAPPPVERGTAEQAFLGALREADGAAFSVRLGAGYGSAELAYNRRVVDENGKVTILESNQEKRPTGPLWPIVPVWRMDDEDGVLRAVVFSCACSGMTAASEEIEKKLGSKVIALFIPGASANLAYYDDASAKLAKEVVRVTQTATPQQELKPALDVYRSSVGRQSWSNQPPVVLESATIVLNKQFALAAVPGVPFVEHQLALSDRSPAAHTILSAGTLTEHGEWAGLLPSIRITSEGGYDSRSAIAEVGTGEELIDTALVNIYRALGKLDDIPRGSLVREMPPEGRKSR